LFVLDVGWWIDTSILTPRNPLLSYHHYQYRFTV
jgi:hypothetical protein